MGWENKYFGDSRQRWYITRARDFSLHRPVRAFFEARGAVFVLKKLTGSERGMYLEDVID